MIALPRDSRERHVGHEPDDVDASVVPSPAAVGLCHQDGRDAAERTGRLGDKSVPPGRIIDDRDFTTMTPKVTPCSLMTAPSKVITCLASVLAGTEPTLPRSWTSGSFARPGERWKPPSRPVRSCDAALSRQTPPSVA